MAVPQHRSRTPALRRAPRWWAPSRSLGPLVALVALAGAATASRPAAAAAAAGARAEYNVTHNLNQALKLPPGTPGPLNAVRGQHIYRNNTSASPGGKSDSKKGTVGFGAGGGTGPDPKAHSTGTFSEADAATDWFVAPIAGAGPVTGFVQAKGWASATPGQWNGASASGESRVWVQGGKMVRGRVRWGPRIDVKARGSAHAFFQDPIDFSIFAAPDDVTPLFSGNLLTIDGNLDSGDFSWDSDTGEMSLSGAQNFSLLIDMTSEYIPVAQRGSLSFTIANGQVTASSVSGIFNTLTLPTLGSTGDFSLAGINALEFDFELPDMGGDTASYQMAFGGGGSADASAVPEVGALQLPALVALWGMGSALGARAMRRRK